MEFWAEIGNQGEGSEATIRTYAKHIQGRGCLIRTEVWFQDSYPPSVNLVFVPDVRIRVNEETKEAFLIGY